MNITFAELSDLTEIKKMDKHISIHELINAINLRRVLVVKKKDKIVGFLRWNLFWDNTPFLNLLFIKENYRHQGLGTALVKRWEKEMNEQNYEMVMTSTLSNERGQFLYRKLGYIDTGSLFLPGEATEIIFRKEI